MACRQLCPSLRQPRQARRDSPQGRAPAQSQVEYLLESRCLPAYRDWRQSEPVFTSQRSLPATGTSAGKSRDSISFRFVVRGQYDGPMSTARARTDGLYFLLLGSLTFIAIGLILDRQDRPALMDFRTAYFSARCLVQHCDPYDPGDVMGLYTRAVSPTQLSPTDRLVIGANVYPPSEFIFTVPFALLPYETSQILWFTLGALSFIFASYLMWEIGARDAPIIAAVLLCFFLINSGSLLYIGNPSIFAVSLCIMAAWCFARQKHELLGVACLAVSLALKPQDSGFVCLCFLMLGSGFRKRALQAVGLGAAMVAPAVLWVSFTSPHWLGEMGANRLAFFTAGSINDPAVPHATCAITSLQAITSFFWSDPHSYNLAAYIVSVPILIALAIFTLRGRNSWENMWLVLASIAALSMLPVYHRQYDAKLIILTIPACAMLWSKRGLLGWTALAVTSVTLASNADFPWISFVTLIERMHLSLTGSNGRLLTALWVFETPFVLLTAGIFYLAVYWRSAFSAASPVSRETATGASLRPEPTS